MTNRRWWRRAALAAFVTVAWACGEPPPTPRPDGGGGGGDARADTGGGDTGPSCATGQALCAGRCVDTSSDLGNCGACGTVCPGGQVCSAGRCSARCDAPRAMCGAAACVDLATDPLNCGACGTACPTGQICDAGRCGCAPGRVACGASCVDTTADPMNCGACGAACAFANATGACAGGACALGACATGFGNCDGMAANGCETDTQTDAMNCGACGTACSLPNATSGCTSGACVLTGCAAGFSNCDAVSGNGCETNVATDPANCGACGNACPAGQTCAAGRCGCAPGETLCGGRCVAVATDPTNCGACGVACPAGQMCVAGACRIDCPPPRMICGAGTMMTCVDLATDRTHCGACGVLCPGTQACVGGACVCPAGQTLCSGACVNTATDGGNCGACGRVCVGGQSCSGGACVCPPGQLFCSGLCRTVASDPNHCGACGRVCGAGATCVGGACTTPGPANNLCASAAPLAVGAATTTVTGSTTAATLDGACGSGPDVWYRFTLTQTEYVYLDTFGSGYDTQVGIYAGCGAAPVAGGCIDDACGVLQSQLAVVLAAGTYYVSVGGFGGGSGSFTLNFQHVPVPTGSASRGVIAAGSSTLSGNNTGAPTQQLGCGFMGPTQWWAYLTCPGYAGGTFTATTCTRASFDTVLEFRNGSGAGGACNDDTCALQSTISGTASAGAGLHVLLFSGYNGAAGAYSIAVTRP